MKKSTAGPSMSACPAELATEHFGQSIHDVGPQRAFARQKLVEHQRRDAGLRGNGRKRQLAGVDRSPQLAAECGFFAGLLSHLVAHRHLGQLAGNLFAVLLHTLPFARGQFPRDSSCLSLFHSGPYRGSGTS